MTVTPATPGWHVHWGQRPYDAMHAAQERLVAARADGALPNVLLTGEHPPVVTLGRKTPGGFPATVGGIPVVASILAPPLTRYATVLLGGDATAADDVVQDALVAGWLALPTLRAPHRLRGWMFSVTHRKAMSWLRYRGIRRSDPLIDDADAEDAPLAPEPPPPTSAEEEARADLYRALGSIPVRYVGPLTLCYLEGLGLRETARVLSLAPNTLKMRLHRGRALLRRRLTRLEGWRLHRRRSGDAPPAAPPTGRDAAARAPRPIDDPARRSPA